MGSGTTYARCQDCGGRCHRDAKRCWACRRALVGRTYDCPDCGGPRKNDAKRCLACSLAHRGQGPQAGRHLTSTCPDCGGACSWSAKTCAACSPAAREGKPVSAKTRGKMRMAALRRYDHLRDRRDVTARMWAAGHTLDEIAAAVGISANRVCVELNAMGVRQHGTPPRGRNQTPKRPPAPTPTRTRAATVEIRCAECGRPHVYAKGSGERPCWTKLLINPSWAPRAGVGNCTCCGTTSRRHNGNGYCTACYMRQRSRIQNGNERAS